MTDQSASQGAVQAAEGHQVHGGEGLGAGRVEVVAVGGVQFEVGHEIGEQTSVHAIRAAPAELVELHGCHAHLRPDPTAGGSTQACGSASLQVVQLRALSGVSMYLPQLSLVRQEVTDARVVSGFDEQLVRRSPYA